MPQHKYALVQSADWFRKSSEKDGLVFWETIVNVNYCQECKIKELGLKDLNQALIAFNQQFLITGLSIDRT